ncbi:HYC_CC_PP family protein [Polluticoccus soli]|uniref:HYC_CC_PP family protein n=1 Tax=Polluticoccus soli TaxID=3034150 RepID=UPI0023E0F5B7|nr:hypothetical protein [Flavipsychrobacter sp. JY13-12]
MKRLIVIPVMFIYLLAVSGIMISAHYCGQQLESWNVYTESDGCADDTCSDEPKQEGGCCKDEVITAKVSQDQNFVAAFKLKLIDNSFEAVLPQYFVLPEAVVNTVVVAARANMPNAPPGLWQHIPLYKLHSSFTYYG